MNMLESDIYDGVVTGETLIIEVVREASVYRWDVSSIKDKDCLQNSLASLALVKNRLQ